MRVRNLMEVISAGHAAKYVVSPFKQTGGIMVVAPPGNVKSTVIEKSLEGFPDALPVSDLNVQTIGYLKEALISGKYSTIHFGEFEKLYERNPGTASNLEGHLRAMIEEGFNKMSFQSPEMAGNKARVFLVCGITPTSYQKRFQHWVNSGFSRRFLWLHYVLENPEAITEAIRAWRLIDFGKIDTRVPANREIPYKLNLKDSIWLESFLKEQPSKETAYALLKKIYCVLLWRHGSTKKAKAIINDVAPSMRRDGAVLIL